MMPFQAMRLAAVAAGGGGTATDRYWRIDVTALKNVADYFCISQMELMLVGVSQFSGGTAISSGGFGGYTEVNAFDGNPAGNPFAANSGGIGAGKYLGYDMGSGNTATGDSLVLKNEGFGAAFNGNDGGSPKDFAIQTSPDGSTWTTVLSVTGEVWTSTSESKTFTF